MDNASEAKKSYKGEMLVGVGLLVVAVAVLAAPTDLLQLIFTGVGRIR